jgi:hypothetical protein
MNRFVFNASIIGLLVLAVRADGHGTPIHVEANTSLVVSGGVSDALGFAQQLFFETSETGDDIGAFTLPSVGNVIVWQIPGFEISGLSETSSFSIEVLRRPVNNVLPVEERSLWYWNPATSSVTATTSPLYLLGTGQRFATIDPANATAPKFLLADPIGATQAQGGQQGFHNHGLLSYGLDNSPAAAAGVYGFFARVVSDEYGASAPMLVVLNRNVEYERIDEAARAINAAAFLPGDFNHDDRVDAADYVAWRNRAGTDEEYGLWRGNFGAAVGAMGSGVAESASVPEPKELLLVGVIGIASAFRRCEVRR